MNAIHRYITVLPEEAVSALTLREDGCYLGGTFGRGGHSRALLEELGTGGRLLGFDKDLQAVQTGKALAAEDGRSAIARRSSVEPGDKMRACSLEGRVDDVLLDLGVSSLQPDNPERGFSFFNDGPLDMRMNPDQGINAAEFIANATEEKIAWAFKEYGEERFARRMARAIVQCCQERPSERTVDLAGVITVANSAWEKGRNPATRAFQGLCIHVNSELGDFERGLDAVLESLAVDGRLVMTSFHSLEDRIVKLFMRKRAKGKAGNPSHGLPIRFKVFEPRLRLLGKLQYASEEELKANPHSRSAVMRVAEKLR